MADTSGKATSPIINDLLSRGHEFSFSQIMRIARRHFGVGGPEELPGVHWQDRVHVRPDLSLTFPAADVVRVERTGRNNADLLVTTTFLGLYGASSPLPTHYTEDLLDEAATDSSVSRDFLDILHQRLYHLYFECWNKYRFFIRLAEENNPQDLKRLYCLIGLGEKELRDSVPDARSLLRYAGLFTQAPRSASGLQTILRDALGIRNLEVEQCVLRRVPIPEEQRTRLGVANMRLGVDTILGSEVMDRMGKFRIHIGPVSAEEFGTLLPDMPRHDKLANLIRLYIVDPLDCDLKITMAAGEARPIRLGDPDGPRLGWNSWCFSGETLGEVSAVFPIAHSAIKVPTPAVSTEDFESSIDKEEQPAFTDYYQRELSRLRDLAATYAKSHPELAAVVTGNPADPSVERLFEGVAFINANLQMKLDDDIPEIIQELTEKLHPWNLKAIPATTIVAFTPKAELTQPLLIAAGTEVASIPIEETKCKFKTCYDVTVHPLTLVDVSYSHPSGKAPSIKLQCELKGIGLSSWMTKSIRFYLGDEYQKACDQYLLLMRYVKRILITAQGSMAVVEMPPDCLRTVGFTENETVLTDGANFLTGHLLLQEYFLFRDKFLFIDLIGLDACCTLGNSSSFEINIELAASLPIVPTVNKNSLILFATPIINIFVHKAKPITITQDKIKQKIIPNAKHTQHYKIYTIDKIERVCCAPSIKSTLTEKCTYSQRNTNDIRYNFINIKQNYSEELDTYLSFADENAHSYAHGVKFCINLTCTNGVLSDHLQIGDICIPTSQTPATTEFRNIKPINYSISRDTETNKHWKVLAVFSLNRTSLDIADNLRSILRLFIPSNNRNQAVVKTNLERLEALASIEARPTDRLIRGNVYRGYDIRMKLNGDHFSGLGDLFLFSSVLERFLGGYVTQNYFTHLAVEDVNKGKIFEWPARRGDKYLL